MYLYELLLCLFYSVYVVVYSNIYENLFNLKRRAKKSSRSPFIL